MQDQKLIYKFWIRRLIRLIFAFTVFAQSACGFNSNIFLSKQEKLILKNDACSGPAVIFVNTPSNEDIVKRWRYLCPFRKINLTDDRNAKATLINAASEFDPDKNTNYSTPEGSGLFCTSKPLLQSLTAFVIPLICNYRDNFGPCIKRGASVKCIDPPVTGDAVEYIGWIPIITHGIPHFIGSIWSDSLQDRIIAAIQKELGNSK